jgi:hypothetical protein
MRIGQDTRIGLLVVFVFLLYMTLYGFLEYLFGDIEYDNIQYYTEDGYETDKKITPVSNIMDGVMLITASFIPITLAIADIRSRNFDTKRGRNFEIGFIVALCIIPIYGIYLIIKGIWWIC